MAFTRVSSRIPWRQQAASRSDILVVSDVFHHGTSETALWEFKHGNGNFKRGDLVGLREIKRRASRQALVHREYNSNIPKPPPTHSQPGTPAETMPPMPESGDPRVNSLEHTLYDVVNRLQRTEEMQHYMHIKHQTMMDTVARLLHFNQELSRTVLSLVPSPENPVHREGGFLNLARAVLAA
jgi:hypothetical protein